MDLWRLRPTTGGRPVPPARLGQMSGSTARHSRRMALNGTEGHAITPSDWWYQVVADLSSVELGAS